MTLCLCPRTRTRTAEPTPSIDFSLLSGWEWSHRRCHLLEATEWGRVSLRCGSVIWSIKLQKYALYPCPGAAAGTSSHLLSCRRVTAIPRMSLGSLETIERGGWTSSSSTWEASYSPGQLQMGWRKTKRTHRTFGLSSSINGQTASSPTSSSDWRAPITSGPSKRPVCVPKQRDSRRVHGNSPATVMLAVSCTMWNSGASPEISHR